MDRHEIRELQKKENKTELEWTLLNYYYTISLITEVLIEESKYHISSTDAVIKIREHLIDNLD